MKIVAVDRLLLRFAAVDEDESEAVAISCVEFLLSETNAYYQQKCLAREAVRSASSQLLDNVVDSAFAAVLEAESTMDDVRFQPESRPEAEPKDRHAVRSVPCKSPEKTASIRNALPMKTSSSLASRVGSSSDKVRVASPVRRKRRTSKGETEKPSASTPPVLMIELEGDPDYEKPEIKEWREKCLKSLETSTKKPGFTKWVKMARVFSVPENRVTMEEGVFAAPPANIVAALAETPVRTKTNIDSFSSILDHTEELEETSSVIENGYAATGTRRTSRRPSAMLEATARSLRPMSTTIHSIAENPQYQSKRRSQSASVDSTFDRRRKTTLLTDSLSRRKLTRKLSLTESVAGGNSNNGWSSSRSLWRYEQEVGSATSRTFVEDDTEFSATSLPAMMSVASGVVLLQGEAVVEGPEWVENTTTMSRKRFDLQQRLATDALLNAPSERDLNSPPSLNLGSPLQFGHYPASPLSELHFRDYEEVPPEPIPIPQLSPISTSALAIPRTHLELSLSTPSLRVRKSTSSGKAVNNSIAGDNDSNRSFSTTSSGNSVRTALGNLKPRPTTALKAVGTPPRLVTGRARATSAAPGNVRTFVPTIRSAAPASAKYLREFPKPKPGIIHVVNDQAARLLGSVEDRQRTAWMT